MVEGASVDAMLDAAGEFRVLTLLPPSPNKPGAPRRTTRALKSPPDTCAGGCEGCPSWQMTLQHQLLHSWRKRDRDILPWQSCGGGRCRWTRHCGGR